MASFAEKLRAAREERGLSQYALAKRAGVTSQALSLLEMGKREPGWETVQRLALALGVDCTAFVDPDLSLPTEEPAARRGRPPTAPAEEAASTPPAGTSRKKASADQAVPKKPARRKGKE